MTSDWLLIAIGSVMIVANGLALWCYLASEGKRSAGFALWIWPVSFFGWIVQPFGLFAVPCCIPIGLWLLAKSKRGGRLAPIMSILNGTAYVTFIFTAFSSGGVH